MEYKIKTFIGCTADCIEINDKLYQCEDPRYGLSDEEREKFHDDLFKQIRILFDDNRINVINLIEMLDIEEVEYSETCDQCFDSATTTTYEEFEIN